MFFSNIGYELAENTMPQSRRDQSQYSALYEPHTYSGWSRWLISWNVLYTGYTRL